MTVIALDKYFCRNLMFFLYLFSKRYSCPVLISFSAKQQRPVAESLPPIGVFWDIENCGVPCRKSALAVVSRIRDRFFSGHREVEFMCVCDISKENREVIQELNYAQVYTLFLLFYK